jgi:hypothetical protein
MEANRMLGLMILGLLGLWLWFAIWLANKLSSYVWRRSTTQSTVIALARNVTTIALLLLLFLLPFIDQIIAYPKWQQLCNTTADFEWGPGMDEKKAFGRELVSYMSTHEITIFPNIKATYYSREYKDKESGELIIKLPHFSYNHAKGMFYLPSSSGNKNAIFLPSCAPYSGDDGILEQFNLKVVEYK